MTKINLLEARVRDRKYQYMMRKLKRVRKSIDCREHDIAEIEKRQAPFRGDIAFSTQPGHIPARAAWLRQEEKRMNLTAELEHYENKAEAIKSNQYHIKGDAERERQKVRDENDKIMGKGSHVNTGIYGTATIMKVNHKTYTVVLDGSGVKISVEKYFCRPIK